MLKTLYFLKTHFHISRRSVLLHITKGRQRIMDKAFFKTMDEPGYGAELTYKKLGV